MHNYVVNYNFIDKKLVINKNYLQNKLTIQHYIFI